MGSFSSALLFLFFLVSSSLANHHDSLQLKVIDIERSILDIFPSPIYADSAINVIDYFRCERVQVSGISRLTLGSYASSFHITLAPSDDIPEFLHDKIQVCFHRNNALGWCQCEKDEWMSIQKGIWNTVMSPYATRYVDVRMIHGIFGSITVSLGEGIDIERPVLGIFYLSIYGSVLGAGSFLLRQFSMFINSILQSFGMSEEMHNPVGIFVLLGIIDALGYWIVRRFVISINKSCGTQIRGDYYSTFHKIWNRKKFSKKEWDELTDESTNQALAELAASPEFSDWVVENAYRIILLPRESSDEIMGSTMRIY